MSDARLRELERRSAQGDARAEAELLRERLRAGELSQARVELAAYLGDPTAQALAPEVSAPEDLAEWLAGIAERDLAAFRLAVHAASRAALSVWEAWGAGEFAPGSAIRRALELVDADPDHHVAIFDALAHARRVLDDASQLLGALEAEHGLNLSAAWAAHRAGLAAVAAGHALEACRHGEVQTDWIAETGSAVAPGRFRDAIRASVVPWLLNEVAA